MPLHSLQTIWTVRPLHFHLPSQFRSGQAGQFNERTEGHRTGLRPCLHGKYKREPTLLFNSGEGAASAGSVATKIHHKGEIPKRTPLARRGSLNNPYKMLLYLLLLFTIQNASKANEGGDCRALEFLTASAAQQEIARAVSGPQPSI